MRNGLVIALGLLVASAAWAELPDFPAGTETKIEDASIGGNGYYLVHVPSDYTPDRKWPLVVCYHGLNGNVTTWPFKNVLGGKRCIVVGMEYNERGSGSSGGSKDVANVKRILPPLVTKLNVDTEQLFIGGFSKGGFTTNRIAGQTLSLWAGILILGAGGSGPGGPGSCRGKAVYIGVGETDQFRKSAETAVASYKRLGAKVTFEIYKGRGHAVDAKSEVMRDWFLANTEFRTVEPAIAASKELVKRQKSGLAYKMLKEAAAMSDTFGLCQEAARQARTLAEAFEKRFAEAEQAAANNQVARAGGILRKLVREFAGCELGQRAKKRIPELSADAKSTSQ